MVAGTRGRGSRGRGRGGRKKGGRRKGDRGSNRDVPVGFMSDLHSPTLPPDLSLPTPDLSLPFLDLEAPLEVESAPFIASPMVARTRTQRSKDRGERSRGGRGRSRDVTTGFTPHRLQTPTATPKLSLPNPDLPPSSTLDSRAPPEVGSVSFIASRKVTETRGQRSRGRGDRRGGGPRRSGRRSSRNVITDFTRDVVTLHSPTRTPNVSSPSLDSLSPTLDSQSPLEAGASLTRSSSTDQGSSAQESGHGGVHLNRNILTRAVEKKVIHIVGLNYMEQEVVRTMTKDFKKHFYGKETQWHLLDKALVEKLYKIFQERYRYETEVEPELARKVWEERSKLRCRGTWTSVRSACIKKTGSTSPFDWKEYRPNFVCQEDWEGILKSWMTEKWKRLSIAGAKNRRKVPGAEEGSSLYVRHTGGSINFGIHRKRLEIELGKKPTQIELFGRLHKRDKGKGEWCDARAKKVAEKYQEKIREKRGFDSESDNDGQQYSDILFDPEAWVEAIGGPKKNHIYGLGLGDDAENVLKLASYTNKRFRSYKTPEELENQIQAQVDARLDARIEALKAEMNAKMQQQLQEMLANLQQSMPSRPPIGRAKGRR